MLFQQFLEESSGKLLVKYLGYDLESFLYLRGCCIVWLQSRVASVRDVVMRIGVSSENCEAKLKLPLLILTH
jgi:hypothetical protein